MKDGRNPDACIWLRDAEVLVKSLEGMTSDPITWKAAILEVHPRRSQFYVGWKPADHTRPAEFYSGEVRTVDDRFAMGVGDGDVIFVVRSAHRMNELMIELVEIVDRDDPRYTEIYHY